MREKINYLGDLHFENGLDIGKEENSESDCYGKMFGVVGYVKKMGKFVRSKEED